MQERVLNRTNYVVETVFAWPGLGRLAIEALFAFDYPLLQGVVITFTLLYVTAAFMVDVLYMPGPSSC